MIGRQDTFLTLVLVFSFCLSVIGSTAAQVETVNEDTSVPREVAQLPRQMPSAFFLDTGFDYSTGLKTNPTSRPTALPTPKGGIALNGLTQRFQVPDAEAPDAAFDAGGIKSINGGATLVGGDLTIRILIDAFRHTVPLRDTAGGGDDVFVRGPRYDIWPEVMQKQSDEVNHDTLTPGAGNIWSPVPQPYVPGGNNIADDPDEFFLPGTDGVMPGAAGTDPGNVLRNNWVPIITAGPFGVIGEGQEFTYAGTTFQPDGSWTFEGVWVTKEDGQTQVTRGDGTTQAFASVGFIHCPSAREIMRSADRAEQDQADRLRSLHGSQITGGQSQGSLRSGLDRGGEEDTDEVPQDDATQEDTPQDDYPQEDYPDDVPQ